MTIGLLELEHVITRYRVLVESDRGHVENFLHPRPIDTLLLEYIPGCHQFIGERKRKIIIQRQNLPMAWDPQEPGDCHFHQKLAYNLTRQVDSQELYSWRRPKSMKMLC